MVSGFAPPMCLPQPHCPWRAHSPVVTHIPSATSGLKLASGTPADLLKPEGLPCTIIFLGPDVGKASPGAVSFESLTKSLPHSCAHPWPCFRWTCPMLLPLHYNWWRSARPRHPCSPTAHFWHTQHTQEVPFEYLALWTGGLCLGVLNPHSIMSYSLPHHGP